MKDTKFNETSLFSVRSSSTVKLFLQLNLKYQPTTYHLPTDTDERTTNHFPEGYILYSKLKKNN